MIPNGVRLGGMTRIPVPPPGTEPPKPDMTVEKAREIRAKLNTFLDECGVYPRPSNEIDGVSFAMYSRMAELHESLCILVDQGRRRDAAILARTLCEAQISYYWLTNKDITERFNRYIKFGAQVRRQNLKRIDEFYELAEDPDYGVDEELLAEAEELFKNAAQWNEKSLYEMANEHDEHDERVDKTKSANNAQYRLFYFWFSLLAHPSAEAIQNFFPPAREPFRTDRPPEAYQGFQEQTVAFLSTMWLFTIFIRMDLTLGLQLGEKIESLWNEIHA